MLQMPNISKPTGLTQRGIKMVEILRNRGGWVTRNDIAEDLKKRVLSHHDREILDRLAKAGYIKIDKHIRDDMVAEYIYQATDKTIEDKS